MRMKRYIISLMVGMTALWVKAAGMAAPADSCVACDVCRCMKAQEDSVRTLGQYERRVARHKRFWSKLTPNQSTLQYAGSIGAVSMGIGWYYGRQRQWETDVMLGYLPKCDADESRATLTLKQSYVPFHCVLGRRFDLEPLSCGLFFNTVFGEGFWTKAPKKYPRKYYGFSTRVRTNVFVGQRIKYKIPTSVRKASKSISLYYELSTCDLYLASYFTNSYLTLWDILSLGVGIRAEIF